MMAYGEPPRVGAEVNAGESRPRAGKPKRTADCDASRKSATRAQLFGNSRPVL